MMDPKYYTVRMGYAPQVGWSFPSSQLDPAPALATWWRVMFAPVKVVSGGFAVTIQECEAPAPAKGPLGDKVHALLRAAPPEPTLGMIYAELLALRAELRNLQVCGPCADPIGWPIIDRSITIVPKEPPK